MPKIDDLQWMKHQRSVKDILNILYSRKKALQVQRDVLSDYSMRTLEARIDELKDIISVISDDRPLDIILTTNFFN